MPERTPPPVPLMSLAVQPHRGKPREIVMDEAGLLRLARDTDAALWAIRAASDRLAPGEVVDATIHEEWCSGFHAGGDPCDTVLLTRAARDDDASDTGDDPTDSIIGEDEAEPDACGEAWPADPALTCFREPGHYGQHAADPGVWPNDAALPNDRGDAGYGTPPTVLDDPAELPAPPGEGPCMTAGCGHDAGDHVQSRGSGERMFCTVCACRRYLGPLPAADGDPDGSQWQPEPVPQALITLECGCSFTGPVTSVKQVYCDTHGRHEPIASVAPYGDGEADEPMPVSYLPLRAAARIGGAS